MKRGFYVIVAVSIFAYMLLLPARFGIAAGPAPKEIKIGLTLAVTGPFSVEWGPTYMNYMKILETVFNERGGVYVKEYNSKLPLKLIIYDDGSSPDRSVQLYEKLATEDKADFFLGPASSPILIKASTVAEKYGIPMIGLEGDSPYIFARGFKWLVGVDTPAPNTCYYYYGLLKHLMDKKEIPELKTVAIVAEDNPHCLDLAWGAEHHAGIAGLKVISKQEVPPGMNDFSPIIVKLKNLNPDVVVAPFFAGTAANFVRQAHETGFKRSELFIPQALLTPAWLGKIGEEIAHGLTAITTVAPFKKGNVDLWNETLKRGNWGLFDLSCAAPRFLGLEALTKAIEAAGTLDRGKVMAALKSVRYESLHGEMFFRTGFETKGMKVDGVGTKPVYIAQYQKGGGIKILWPLDLATGTYIRR